MADESLQDPYGIEADPDPVSLAARGKRRGSRFSSDGTPLSLRTFLQSSSAEIHFFFQRKNDPNSLQPLDDVVERRAIGEKVRYENVDGEFRLASNLSNDQLDSKTNHQLQKLCDVYRIDVNLELAFHVGIYPGCKAPVVTDKNPHQEGLIDHRRTVFMPYSENRNVLMALPNIPGLFFTSQAVSGGGEVAIAYDRALLKHWVMVVNQAYTPAAAAADEAVRGGEPDEDRFRRRAVDNGHYLDKVFNGLLTDLGNGAELMVRISPSSSPEFINDVSQLSLYDDDKSGLDVLDKRKPRPQQRLDDYFQDEIRASGGKVRFFYYETECMVYGLHEDGDWKFGIKDRGGFNGHKIGVEPTNRLGIQLTTAEYPL